MTTLTIRQIQYVLAVADETDGSFTRAAEGCYVTQSTLSAGIKEAEAVLGHALFQRSHHGAALTPFGEDILDTLRRIMTDIRSISTEAERRKGPMRTPIRLGIIPTLAPYLLPQILPLLDAECPDLHLEIHEDLSHRLAEELRCGRLDLLLLALPFSTPGARHMPLWEEPFFLATPYADTSPVTPDALDPDALLLLADGHCLTDHALQACALQRTGKRRRYSASSIHTLIQMVAAGMGETLLPAMITKTDTLPSSVHIRPFTAPAPTRMIGLAWRADDSRVQDYESLGRLIQANH